MKCCPECKQSILKAIEKLDTSIKLQLIIEQKYAGKVEITKDGESLELRSMWDIRRLLKED